MTDPILTPVVVCAWCDRLKHGDEQWAVAELDVNDTTQLVSHGMCPDCEAVMNRQLDAVEGTWKEVDGDK